MQIYSIWYKCSVRKDIDEDYISGTEGKISNASSKSKMQLVSYYDWWKKVVLFICA